MHFTTSFLPVILMSVSRRHFLQSSTIVSATIAAPVIAATQSWMDEAESTDPGFSERARDVLRFANQNAQVFEACYVGSEHLLLGLAEEAEHSDTRWLDDLGLNYEDLLCLCRHMIPNGPQQILCGKLPNSENLDAIVDTSKMICKQLGHDTVRPEHFLLSIIDTFNTKASEVLEQLWLERGAYRQVAIESLA